MFRTIRLVFLTLLGLVLVTVAIANRGATTVRLLPQEIDEFFSLNTQVELPLYLIIYCGIVAGLLIGFIWEWIREARIRGQASQAQREVSQLQREVKDLKGPNKKNGDDVLALLE